jgi:hypothetical protein
VERAAVLSAYGEGVRAIPAIVAGWSTDDWRRPACGSWTATDLAGHLLAVVRWYHAWLDRAEAGDPAAPFTVADLPERNERALAGLRPTTGEDRIELFVEEAERYAARLDSSWALPYGCPLGTMTAGDHAALAACEWHLHAWDLSGGAHRPSAAGALLTGAVRARASAAAGLRFRVEVVVAPVVARSRPWARLLTASGRQP